MPSIVGYSMPTPKKRQAGKQKSAYVLVGNPAKKAAPRQLENTLYDAKRMIGKTFNDPYIQELKKAWPFEVVEGEKQRPMFKIKSPDGEDRLLNPEEVQAKVLETLKKSATNKLKIPENQKMNCVITVPAYFNDSQKQSTMQDAKIAGLECQAIINEPTAAAIAFTCQVDQENEGPRKLCIFDFGGGTFDVSILTITNRKIEVKAIEGDNQLGGQDIDHKLCTYLIEKIKEENDGKDISTGKNGKKNVQKLR